MDGREWSNVLNTCLQLSALRVIGKKLRSIRETRAEGEAYTRLEQITSLGSQHTISTLSDDQGEITTSHDQLDAVQTAATRDGAEIRRDGWRVSYSHENCPNSSKVRANKTLGQLAQRHQDEALTSIERRVDIADLRAGTWKTIRPNDSHLHRCNTLWRRLCNVNISAKAEVLESAAVTGTTDQYIVAFSQAASSLDFFTFYFTVEIIELGREGYVAVGLSPREYPCDKMPGWAAGSVAYHADDGRVYAGSQDGTRLGPTLKRGDKLSCGILYQSEWIPDSAYCNQAYEFTDGFTMQEKTTPSYRQTKVFFSLNSKLLGVKIIELPVGHCYPTIGLMSQGSSVRVNLSPRINES